MTFSVRTSVAEELPYLRRYARSLAKDDAAADDLVQDCVERAIQRANQFTPGTNFRAWLCTILRSVFLNQRRRGQVRQAAADHGLGGPSIQSPAQEDHMEIRRVETALARMPSEYRAVLIAVVLDGRSYEDAARTLDVPVGTVRSRLARARDLLAERRRRPPEEAPARTAAHA